MSQRFRFLSVLAVLCGGLVWWSLLPQPLSGQNQGEQRPAEAQANEPTPNPAATTYQAATAIPAPPPHRAEGDFDLYEPDKAEEKISKALTDPRGVEIEFIDTPLKHAMEFIGDQHDITIIIDEAALKDEGVAIDAQISKILSGIKLASALKIILEPLGLTYIIEDEVLKITTQTAADEKRITRVYNTGYLKQIGVEPESLSQTIQSVVEPNEWSRNDQQTQAMTTYPKLGFVLQDGQNPANRQKAQTDPSVFHFQGAVLSTVQHGGGGLVQARETQRAKPSAEKLHSSLGRSAGDQRSPKCACGKSGTC